MCFSTVARDKGERTQQRSASEDRLDFAVLLDVSTAKHWRIPTFPGTSCSNLETFAWCGFDRWCMQQALTNAAYCSANILDDANTTALFYRLLASTSTLGSWAKIRQARQSPPYSDLHQSSTGVTQTWWGKLQEAPSSLILVFVLAPTEHLVFTAPLSSAAPKVP